MKKPTDEYHKDCNGRIFFVDSPFLASWVCDKCKQTCPITETYTKKNK